MQYLHIQWSSFACLLMRATRSRTFVIEKDGNVLIAKEAIDLFDVVLNNEIEGGQEMRRRILFQMLQLIPRFGILFRNLDKVFLFFYHWCFCRVHYERIISGEGILVFVLYSMKSTFHVVCFQQATQPVFIHGYVQIIKNSSNLMMWILF